VIVALVTPSYVPAPRGNAVTAGRVALGLERLGVTVSVVDLSQLSEGDAFRALAESAPQIVHAFHAFSGGPPALDYARWKGVPLVVSLTGTDVNYDLSHPERGITVRKVLEGADALTAFHETVLGKVADVLPGITAKIRVIPQGVRLGGDAFSLPPTVPVGRGDVLFLVPAGIRKVKNTLFPISPLGRLATRFPDFKLLFAGPVLEEDEGARLFAAIARCPWAFYLGAVPHDQMASLLRQVDVVVNSSLSEGGMANSVLEAMSLGRAVLASDIDGNRSIIQDGVDGLLYGTPEEFEAKAERLLLDPALRARLGRAARRKVVREFSPQREAQAYLALYHHLLGSRGDQRGGTRGPRPAGRCLDAPGDARKIFI